MNEYNLKDTIVALSTAPFKSALAIVRLSGGQALNIAKRICYDANSENLLLDFEHRRSYYVIVKDEHGIPIDELVILVMKAPNTFTTEDVVEFFLHGSLIVIDNLISLLLRSGARLAVSGEFSYRAYINGRINIGEAEATNDLIESVNKLEATASIYKMRGRLESKITPLRDTLKSLLATIEGELDFPEDDTDTFSYSIIIDIFKNIDLQIKNILSSSNTVQNIMNGVKVAIVGRVNVGKSSIFNMLLGTNRSIVSNIAGTTRDSINEILYVDSIAFHLTDTAGFHENTSNEIEMLGIERTKKCALESDLILAVFDINDNLGNDDLHLLNFLDLCKNKKVVYLLNKVDLPGSYKNYNHLIIDPIMLSAKTSYGREDLLSALSSNVSGDIDVFNRESYVNARERGYLERARLQISICIDKAVAGFTLDEVAEETRTLNNLLGNVSGFIDSDDIVNEIFSKFCIGK